MFERVPTLSRHYSTLWLLMVGAYRERGVVQGAMNAFLEYVMPVLVVALIIATAMPRRAKAGAGG